MPATRIIGQSCSGRIVADAGLDEFLDQLIERLLDAFQHHEPLATQTIARDRLRDPHESYELLWQ